MQFTIPFIYLDSLKRVFLPVSSDPRQCGSLGGPPMLAAAPPPPRTGATPHPGPETGMLRDAVAFKQKTRWILQLPPDLESLNIWKQS